MDMNINAEALSYEVYGTTSLKTKKFKFGCLLAPSNSHLRVSNLSLADAQRSKNSLLLKVVTITLNYENVAQKVLV